MADDDPHPNPRRFVGLTARFDHGGRRLVGTVKAQRYIGRTARGAIPNHEITVVGATGRELKVDMVESYTTFDETKS